MYVANLLQGAPAKDHAAITLARVRERLDALDAMLRRPDAPLPSRSSDAYLGRYRSDTLGEIEVRAGDGDTLVLQLGPAALPVELTPWSGDIFRADITIPPVTGEGRSTGQSILVRFVPDLSGEITRLEWGGAPKRIVLELEPEPRAAQ